MKVLSYTLAIVRCANSSISDEGIDKLCSYFKDKENINIVVCDSDKSGIAFRGLFPGMVQLTAYVDKTDGITGFSKVIVNEKVCAPGIVLFNANIDKAYTIDLRSEDEIIDKYKTILTNSINFIESLC